MRADDGGAPKGGCGASRGSTGGAAHILWCCMWCAVVAGAGVVADALSQTIRAADAPRPAARSPACSSPACSRAHALSMPPSAVTCSCVYAAHDACFRPLDSSWVLPSMFSAVSCNSDKMFRYPDAAGRCVGRCACNLRLPGISLCETPPPRQTTSDSSALLRKLCIVDRLF